MKRPERLRELTIRLSPALLAYFERRVEPREDAADLLNETLIVAWKKIAQVPADPDEERAWLYGVAANVLSNHTRSSGRRSRLVERIRQQILEPVDDTSNFALSLDVARAIQGLEAPSPELIRLVHWDGLFASEAGRVLGMPESTARARYSAAKKQLQESLAHLEETK